MEGESHNKPLYHEQCTPFVFNEAEPTLIQDENITKLLDFMLFYLMPDKNPRAKLAALCFASGMNVGSIFGCDNTQTAISTSLNISRLYFHKLLTQVERDFGLKNINNK